MKVALMDLDYTLVDIMEPDLFENLVMKILSETFSRQVEKEVAHEIVRGNFAYLTDAGIREPFLEKFNLETPNLRLRAIQLGVMKAMPGAHKLLSELEAREYYVALVTNAPRQSAKVALDYLWLTGYFKAFSYNNGSVIKPHEEPAMRVLKGLQNIESIFFLGDSSYDVNCGKNLSAAIGQKVITIYFDRSKKGNVHEADFVVTKLDEVIGLLEKGEI